MGDYQSVQLKEMVEFDNCLIARPPTHTYGPVAAERGDGTSARHGFYSPRLLELLQDDSPNDVRRTVMMNKRFSVIRRSETSRL